MVRKVESGDLVQVIFDCNNIQYNVHCCNKYDKDTNFIYSMFASEWYWHRNKWYVTWVTLGNEVVTF